MISRNVTKRFVAIAFIIAGLLIAVLTPAAGGGWELRSFGFALAAGGAAWLTATRNVSDNRKQTEETAADQQSHEFLRWYQSPILWIPVIAIVIGVLAWAL